MLTLERFDAIAAREPYRRKGMFYSEVYLFLDACQRQRCDLVIESGVKNGMSTSLLLASGVPAELIAIDKAEGISLAAIAPTDPPFPFSVRFQFRRGDALQLLPRLFDERSESRIAVLIDGPKGSAALRLKNACMARRSCLLVGVHDAAPGLGETRHSREASFQRSAAKQLDRFVGAEYRSKYPAGPGLGIWEKP